MQQNSQIIAMPEQGPKTVSQLRAVLDDKPGASEIVLLIAPLFQAFPSFQDDTTGNQKMDLFVIALEGRSRSSIKAAVKDFIKGNVANHDGRFLPPPAQVAKQALKRHEGIINSLDKAKRRERPKPTPESAKPAAGTRKPKDAIASALIGAEKWPDQAFLSSLPAGTLVQPHYPQITLKTGETMSFAGYREANKEAAQ